MDHALLTGRTVLLLTSKGYSSAEMLSAARALGRGRDFIVVRHGHGGHPVRITGHEARWPVPPESEWNGLPPLSKEGSEIEFAPDDPAGTAYRAAEDMAWAGHVPGPGLRLAKGDGGVAPHNGIAREQAGAALVFHDPSPALDVDNALGKFLVVESLLMGPRGAGFFAWLALALVERAERSGVTPPLIVADCARLQVLSRLLGWSVLDEGNLGVCTPYRDPAAPPSREKVQAAVVERVAAMQAACRVSRDGDVWIAEGNGRTVLAIRMPWDAAKDIPGVLFAMVEPSRWLHVELARLRKEGDSNDEGMAVLVRGAWLTSPSVVKEVRSTTPAGHPLHEGVTDMVPLGAMTRLRSLLREMLDPDWLDFHAAASRAGWVPTLTSWAREPGGATERRRQFVVSHRPFARLVLDRKLAEAIDAGRSPTPRLRELTGLPAWAMRRLMPRRNVFGDEDPSAMPWAYRAAILNAIGPDRAPSRDDWIGWYWLGARVIHLRPIADPSQGEMAGTARAVARLVAGGPRNRWRGLGEGAPWFGQLSDLRDFLASLRGWTAGLVGDQGPGRLALASEYGSLPALYRASRLWHEEPRLSRRTGDVPPDASWPVPFGTVDLGQGWSAVAVADVASLEAEGSAGTDVDGMPGLAHCVATYAPRCVAGLCAIVSLRVSTSEGPRRHSTAQLVMGPSDAVPRVVQHKAFRNAVPIEAAKAALERLIERIGAGAVPFDRTAFEPRGYDATGRVIPAEEMFGIWRPILPPAWRTLAAARAAVLELVRAATPAPPVPDGGIPFEAGAAIPDADVLWDVID